MKDVIHWAAGKMEKHDLSTIIEEKGQPRSMNEEVQTTLRRCISELLYNIIKRANADTARIIISYASDAIQVTVKDDGDGFVYRTEI